MRVISAVQKVKQNKWDRKCWVRKVLIVNRVGGADLTETRDFEQKDLNPGRE